MAADPAENLPVTEDDDDDAAIGDDCELSPAWQAEIARRLQSVRDGTAKLVSHEEMMAMLDQWRDRLSDR